MSNTDVNELQPFSKIELRPLLAPKIAYHLTTLSAPCQSLIHKAHSADHMPQSLTAECSLPSFCVILSEQILSPVFQSFLHISEHRLVHNGNCREHNILQKVSVSFVAHSWLLVAAGSSIFLLQLTLYKRLRKSVRFYARCRGGQMVFTNQSLTAGATCLF